MIRQTFTTDTTIDSDIEWLNAQEEMLFDIGFEIKEEIEPSLLSELDYTPPKRNYPADYPGGQLPFETEKQRRWYWANIGKPYVRTGQHAKSYELFFVEQGNGFQLIVQSNNPAAKYIVGSLAQNRTEALRFQQKFHQVTGWQAATDTVTYWFDVAAELLEEKLDERIRAQVNTKRRAYTKGTPRK